MAANRLALSMVTMVRQHNARSWREAASRSSMGRFIYAGIEQAMHGSVGHATLALTEHNARLIRSLPGKIAQQTANFIGQQQRKGLRSEQIAAQLRERLPEMTRAKAKLIARTEVAKAQTAFMQARAEQFGFRWYVWRTSEDQRVRPSHRIMDGVLCAWDDAPSPEALFGMKSHGMYSPGGIENCRCDALPITDLRQVRFPAKVYSSGQIRRMTLAEFSRFSGLQPRRRAA
jgi:SPP1 gp7 family putative phage head morphogenesis protein